LIPRAREINVRLVLLWFGTWKNTGPAYAPEWVKADSKRFPRMTNKEGKPHYVNTPLSRNTLEAEVVSPATRFDRRSWRVIKLLCSIRNPPN
jgi:beta-galactosidase GanA